MDANIIFYVTQHRLLKSLLKKTDNISENVVWCFIVFCCFMEINTENQDSFDCIRQDYSSHIEHLVIYLSIWRESLLHSQIIIIHCNY